MIFTMKIQYREMHCISQDHFLSPESFKSRSPSYSYKSVYKMKIAPN